MKTFATLFLATTLALPVLANRAYTDADGNKGVLKDTPCQMEGVEKGSEAKEFELTMGGKVIKGCYLDDGDLVLILTEDGALFQMPSQLFE